jgi:cysteine desulfuration protein SufE
VSALETIRDDFLALEARDRLQLLLEFSDDLPALPPEYGAHPERLERVTECQAPVFVTVEVRDGRVQVLASAPPEAPTTRGFASILVQVFDGLTVDEALAVPDDYPDTLGLTALVSPLRLRGMAGLLARIKRRLRARP